MLSGFASHLGFSLFPSLSLTDWMLMAISSTHDQHAYVISAMTLCMCSKLPYHLRALDEQQNINFENCLGLICINLIYYLHIERFGLRLLMCYLLLMPITSNLILQSYCRPAFLLAIAFLKEVPTCKLCRFVGKHALHRSDCRDATDTHIA